MTLTVYAELEQGSPEWLQARCGLPTASVIGRLITPSTLKVANNDTSRDAIRTLAAERISGHVEYVHPTMDMQRGTLDEPLARDLYARTYAPVEEIGFAVREINGHKLGASPDGLVGEDGGIEIKSRKPSHQLKAFLTQAVPVENMAQIQALMLVLGRKWWDYCSYAGGWPLFVKRVYPDPRWQDAIRAALESFEKEVALQISIFEQASAGAPIAPRVDHFADAEIRI
jgi:hypothetical protein